MKPRITLRLAVVACLAAAIATVPTAAGAEPGQGFLIQGADAPDAIAGSYIVVFKDSAAAGAEDVNALTTTLAARHKAAVTQTYVTALRGFAAKMSKQEAEAVAADPAVEMVAQDQWAYVQGTQPNPPSWGLDRIDQRDRPLNNSYTYPSTAPNVHLYVLDTGIRISHNDFGGRAVWDFNNVDGTNTDCNGHGTHVAGTAGGASYGVAKAVRLHAVKVLGCNGRGPTSGIIAGVDWVTAHSIKPAVANMSLGGGRSIPLETAVLNSIDSGVTYTIAAGNSNDVACRYSPAAIGYTKGITVGATTITDAKASFSNWGACVDLYAPGQNIVSAWHTSNTATASNNGTSMAAPHAAGVAALYLAANPNATTQQVHDHVVFNTTVDRITGLPNCCGSAAVSRNALLYSLHQPPGPGTNLLNRGQNLLSGRSIRSHRGNHVLVMQPDGNLVHYQGTKALWSSGTHNNPGAWAAMQHDGNFVIYRSNNTPLWATNTHGTNANQLVMQDDANIVLYGPRPAGRPGIQAYWSSR